MGIDIHMFIVHNGKLIKNNIFDGKNSSWFANLRNQGDYNEYDYLPIVFGWAEGSVPKELRKRYTCERGYFDHYHIKVKYFMDWFQKYRPNIDAGWVTTYVKWLIEKKGYTPEYLPKDFPKDGNVNDLHFVEYPRCDDCSQWLYDYLIENNIDENADIIYCFDW